MARTLGLLLVLINSIPCVAQSPAQSSGELRGTVKDQTEAFMPLVPVTLEDGQGKKLAAQTDERGRYRFSGLKPGLYTLKVEGFTPVSQQIDLSIRQSLTFDVTLEVFIAEQIEVKTEKPSISVEPENNLSAIVLTEVELEALPDDPDELLETLKMMAGAAGGRDDSAARAAASLARIAGSTT